MDTVPGFSIRSGLFRKSKVPIFYSNDYGYLYPPLTDITDDFKHYNKGLLFDFSGLYLGKPALRSVRTVISQLPDMGIWLYSGVRDLNDLIDAVVLEPECVFVSTATAYSLDDMKEMFEDVEIAALGIDMDSKGNIIWHSSTKIPNIDLLLAMVEEFDLMGLGIFFWDGEVTSNISNKMSYNIRRIFEVVAKWHIPVFVAGPFTGEHEVDKDLFDYSNIYMVIPYNMME